MPQSDKPFALYDTDLDEVWRNNPVAFATRRAALYARADEVTTLRAVILQMHKAYETQHQQLLEAITKAKSFDLMTEGVTLEDGRRFVFRPPVD